MLRINKTLCVIWHRSRKIQTFYILIKVSSVFHGENCMFDRLLKLSGCKIIKSRLLYETLMLNHYNGLRRSLQFWMIGSQLCKSYKRIS